MYRKLLSFVDTAGVEQVIPSFRVNRIKRIPAVPTATPPIPEKVLVELTANESIEVASPTYAQLTEAWDGLVDSIQASL